MLTGCNAFSVSLFGAKGSAHPHIHTYIYWGSWLVRHILCVVACPLREKEKTFSQNGRMSCCARLGLYLLKMHRRLKSVRSGGRERERHALLTCDRIINAPIPPFPPPFPDGKRESSCGCVCVCVGACQGCLFAPIRGVGRWSFTFQLSAGILQFSAPCATHFKRFTTIIHGVRVCLMIVFIIIPSCCY